MGNNECNKLMEQNQSSAYGVHQLIIKNNQQLAIIKKTINQSSVIRSQIVQQLGKRKNINSNHIVKMYNYEIVEDGEFLKISLQYQFIRGTLLEKVQNWRNLGQSPSEAELVNLIMGVETGLKQLYDAGVPHRCLNLQTILCFNSLYKLTDISMNTFLTGYDLALQGDQHQFLSQNLLNLLQFQSTKPIYDIEDDLFSLGMIVLAIVLNCQPKHFYIKCSSSNCWQHNKKKIQEGLKLLQKLYCPLIFKKVKGFICGTLKSSRSTRHEHSIQKTIT